MSTWDDKPNDYEHALAEIERLRAENERLRGEHGLRFENRRLQDANAAMLAAGSALIADVRRRYPDEELRCQYMRALDAAIKAAEGEG